MAKRGKTNSLNRGAKAYWQASELNQRYEQFFRSQLIQLALARFRWVNLPTTCDARYLEMQLCMQGIATIAAPRQHPDTFVSLRAVPKGVNMYGNPPRWIALGDNGTQFACNNTNGVFIYDNMLRTSTVGNFTLLAHDMADIMRTKQVNRMHIKTPVVLVGDERYRQQMVELFKQSAGHEAGVIATRGISNIQFDAKTTGVPFLGKELNEDLQNTWNLAFTFLGISNLPFKTERQTADEVKDYSEPTDLLSLNPLSCRREACEKFNDRFGVRVYGRETPKKLECHWNDDFESRSYNVMHDLSAFLQTYRAAGASPDDLVNDLS